MTANHSTRWGRAVSPGAGVGPVVKLAGNVPEPPRGAPPSDDPAGERAAVAAALEAVARELERRGGSAVAAGGDAEAVLSAQALMARDPGIMAEAGKLIDAGAAAPVAVYDAFGVYRDALAGAGDYIAARVADLDDVRDRTVAHLMGLPAPYVPEAGEPYVLVARDLAPADTAMLDPATVRAFVTEQGGPTSHTAILARSMGVPAVVACPGATELSDGTVLLVDGGSGAVIVEPDEAQVSAATGAAAARARLAADATGPGATADGRAVPLLANIGGPADVPGAVAAGAEGVGLYRTEFLFLDRAMPPPVAEQVEAYRAALEAFPGGRVVVRTLDAGADKPLEFLPIDPEPNPALGERGLRMSRRHPRVLQDQLGALREASAAGGPAAARLDVMAPMVAGADEARWFAGACRDAGLGRHAQFGVMIEVPSAALRAADVVAEVDFLSLGTNDLAQYTFAADRQIGALGHWQDPWQPALLDLVGMSATAADRAGRGCGVCGEAAADPVLACVLVGLGVTSLSMGVPAIPLVRAALARHTVAQCETAAAAARAAAGTGPARAAARGELPGVSELGL